jgi:ParB-like chromosome segregation protein Spo0J
MNQNVQDGLAMPEKMEMDFSLVKGRGGLQSVDPRAIQFKFDAIYDERPDQEEEAFVEDIRSNGILQRPGVRLKDDGAIEGLHGRRRVAAAIKLGIEQIEVDVFDVDDDDVQMFVVQTNNYRQKTHVDLYRELKIRKQHIAKRRGQRTDLDDSLTEAERMHTDDRLAAEMGISASKVSRLEKVGDTDIELLKIVDDNDDVSLTETYNACKSEKPKEEKAVEEVDHTIIKPCPFCGSQTRRIVRGDGKLEFKQEEVTHE